MLELEKRYVDEMVAHALEDDPNECCGFIAGQEGRAVKLYRMTNIAASPYRYDMDPKQVYEALKEARENGWDPDPLVIYHSHTHSPAYPSPTDVRIATWDGVSTWPDTCYVLISLMGHDNPVVRAFRIVVKKLLRVLLLRHPVVRAFRIVDGEIAEEELRVI